MQVPVEIHFVNLDRSDAVESVVRQRVEKLERFYDGITSCIVMIDAPHRQHRKGNAYDVRIEARVPGTELVVANKPGDVNAHHDLHIAVRDAFDAMERMVRKWKEQLKDPPKARESPLQGRISELHGGDGYGYVQATDGRLVYFHKNSVVGTPFEQLNQDDPVELVVQSEESAKGPQASTVKPIRPMEYIDRAKQGR
jgi:ribosomal subunit interface protein